MMRKRMHSTESVVALRGVPDGTGTVDGSAVVLHVITVSTD